MAHDSTKPTKPPSNRPPRPIDLSLLVILSLGLSFVTLIPLLASDPSPWTIFSHFISRTGLMGAMIIISMLFNLASAGLCGIGIWIGKKWGWWGTLFYFAYSIARSLNGLFQTASVAQEFTEDQARGTDFYFAKFGIRIVINIILFFYFFKPHVLEYFQLSHINKQRAALQVIAAVIALSVISFALPYLFA